jgi:hypothetical protein
MRSASLILNVLVLCAFLPDAKGQIGCTFRGNAVQSSCSQISKTFGDSYNDTGYNREISLLRAAFEVQPGYFACMETGGPNAFAGPDTLEPGTSGSVFLGVKLARGESDRIGQYNILAVSAILAHETGHIVQFLKGNRLPTKLKELQADYLAGWYLANRDRTGTPQSETAVRQNMSTFYKLGDYNYNDSNHQGTPDERLAAIMAGFRSANMPLAEVYQASNRFVASQAPADDSGGGSGLNKDIEAQVNACMKTRIASCMADCIKNYGLGQAQCSIQLCSPGYVSNQAWERACAPQGL